MFFAVIRSVPALSLVLALMVADPAVAADPPPRTVSVSASGSVEATPDMATFSAGVVSEAQTAREALGANSKQMSNVIDGLKGLGIAAKDLQTHGFSVQPRYSNASSRDGRAPTINGYRASNSLRILVRDLKRLGEIMDKAVSLGANQGGGIQFVVSKAETLLDKARKSAMENALRRARLYAGAAGVEVGRVLSISEQSHAPGPRPMAYGRAAMAAEAVPVESGTETLTATVHVTYELR
ncbi:MAG: SIMPL domain-containing protein [Hyphomicrobiaceae bacterium]